MKKSTLFAIFGMAFLIFGFSQVGWGQVESIIYSTGFESPDFPAGTVYNNTTVAYTGPAGQQWGTYYGTPSTTSPLTASQSMQMRWYTTAPANLGYTFTNFDLANVSKVTFKAANTSGINIIASYSTNGGTSFAGEQTFTLSTTGTEYTFNISATGEYPNVRIKFALTAPTVTSSRLIIDDIAIYGITSSTPTVATPIFTPPSGKYLTTQNIGITTTTLASTIYYTTDGSDPDINTSTEYTGTIPVSANTTIKAKAYATGYDPSSIGTATYTFPTEVANIAALRAASTSGFYKLAGETVLTYQSIAGKTKYIQDATGAILIYDGSSTISTPYNVGDGIKDIYCTLSMYSGMLELIPFADPGAATSVGNTVTPEVLTLANLTTDYQGKLVKVLKTAVLGTGNFAASINYPLADDSGAGALRTAYSDLDYIGNAIPGVLQDITGVVLQFNTAMQIVPRSTADFEDYVSPPTLTADPANLTGFTFIEGSGPSEEQTFTVSGADLTNDISITASTNYEISTTPGAGYTSPITLTPSLGIVSSTTIYVRLKAGLTAGAFNGEVINITSTGATPKTVTCSGTVINPVLSVGTLSDFGDVCINSISGPSTFTITGSNLSNAGVTVGALEGFTYSTTAEGTYTPTLTFLQVGGAFSATVYVNFSPILVQSYNGNIPVGGGGASSVNAAAAGSGINTPPSVSTTYPASLITETSATCEGDVTDGGCAIVTARGICYGTAVNPDITGLKTTEPGSIGAFSSLIEGLIPATLYHFRAYVTSGGETAYGSDLTFTTLSFIAPTSQASNILFSSVSSTGLTADWTNGGGANRVVLINTINNFSTPIDGSDPVANKVYNGSGEQVVYNGSGSSVSVTGLNYNTIYWFRVYEYNGTALTSMYCTADGLNNPARQATNGILCGTKTVGVGGDYATITSAFADLNSSDLCGPLNLILTDITYPNETFPLVIQENASSNSINTVTIKPAIGVSPFITCDTYNSTIILNGSDYVIFDGSNQIGGSSKDLTIANTYTGDVFNSVFNVEDNGAKGTTNTTIMNCIIQGSPTVHSWGLYFIGDMDLGRNNENISILNNTVKNSFLGIHISDAKNSIISNNIIGDNTEPIEKGGIEILYCDNTLITRNEIFGEMAGNLIQDQYGIFIASLATNSKIIKNKIHDFYYAGSDEVACWGIKYAAEANSPTEISNNLIYNIKSDGDMVSRGSSQVAYIPSGISILSGGNVQLYFNSINLTGNVLGTNGTTNISGNSACVIINTEVTNIDIRNNIFKNSMTAISGNGANKTYGVVSYSTNTSFSDINYNDYYIDGLNPYIGYLSGDMIALADWQTAISKDANSVSSDPGFVSDTDLHPSLSGPNNTGITIPGITTDFAEATRSNPPDMGAYEYSIMPTVITDAASNIDLNSAQLNGTVTADYASTDVSFEWGLTTSYGNTIAAIPAIVDGGSATAVMATLIGLAENTTYHYRCIGVNVAGTTYGDDQSFLTVFTGITDNTTVQSISAYPNPSHGHFILSITSAKKEVYDLRILNSLGIPVYECKTLMVNGTLDKIIELSHLQQGMYSVVLNSDNKQIIRKIVIN